MGQASQLVDVITSIGNINSGATQNQVTPRCFGITGGNSGLSLTCDIHERAISSSCIWRGNDPNDPGSTFLLTSGRIGHRSAGCSWSGKVNAAIIVFCKAIGPRRGGELRPLGTERHLYHKGPLGLTGRSDRNPLHLIEADVVTPAIKSCVVRVVAWLAVGFLSVPAPFRYEVTSVAPEGVIAHLGLDADSARLSADHCVGAGLGYRHAGEPPRPADSTEQRQLSVEIQTIDGMRLLTFGLHALKGDLKGFCAVTVRELARVFRFDDGRARDVDLVDYH